MALSGSFNTSAYSDRYITVSWSATQNIANNTSTVSWTIRGAGGGTSNWYTSGNFEMWANGAQRFFSATRINLYNGTTVASGSFVVAHDTQGNANLNMSMDAGIYYVAQNVHGQASWALNNIPRATKATLNKSSFNLGETMTITLPRASTAFTHDIQSVFNNVTTTIATGVATSTTFVVPAAWANSITTGVQGSANIRVTTKNGSTVVGTAQNTAFTVVVPDTTEYRPTISNISINNHDNAIKTKFNNAFIQTRSQLDITFNATGAYGSTITSRQVIFNNQWLTLVNNIATTELLINHGSQQVELRATDSRKRTVIQNQNINVLEYNLPVVTELYVQRANSDGSPNEEGTYVTVRMNAAITPLNNLNDKLFKLEYKVRSATNWTTVDVTNLATGYNLINATKTIAGFNTDNMYDFRLIVQDYFETTERTTALSTAFAIMDFLADGTSMALGKVAEIPGRLEVGAKLPMHIMSPGTTDTDSGFIRFRRADGTVESFLASGAGGKGLNLHHYDSTTWQGATNFDMDGTVRSKEFVADGGWKSYTPQFIGWSSTSGFTARYTRINNTVYVDYAINGTSNNAYALFSLPIPAKVEDANYNNMNDGSMLSQVIHGSALTRAVGITYVAWHDPYEDPTTGIWYDNWVQIDLLSGVFATSGGKNIYGKFIYEC